MYFENYRFPKLLLDEYLKIRVSEDPLTSNMVNEIKQRWNLNDTAFTIFIHQYEGN